MLLPRFSTRVILVVMAICAVYFLMVGLAIRGSIWATGVAVAATSIVFLALVHAAFFALCYWIGRVFMKPKSTRQSATIAAVVAASLLGLARSLPAGTGEVLTLPPPRVTAPSGLQLTVDTTWVESYGYLPVQVTVTSPKPSPADQTITFRFKAGNWRLGQQPLIAVDQDIELAEGDTTATATVLVPKLQEWQFVWWDVLVDGDFEKELSVDRTSRGWVNQMGGFSGDEVPRLLVVANEGQQVNMSATIVNENNYASGYTVDYGFGGRTTVATAVDQSGNATPGGVAGIAGVYFAAQRTVANLPTQWLAYTGLDQLVLTAGQLEQIQSENPQAWTAIERWVRAGGNLWLCDLGDGWQKLPVALERLDTVLEKNEDGEIGWYSPFTTQNVPVSSVFTREATAQERAGELPGGVQFAWRPAGMGAILISQQPFEEVGNQEWEWLQVQEGRQLGWAARHGTVPSAPNASFANLLIPGVGLAPVTEFRILITLFVVLIGPVNYWFLKRYKRLHLLILSVPLAALLVTLALFGYAIVGDGLSTRLRVRSFTALDQRTGEAASWARTSYYAGLAPSGGLEFPTDAAVYPINPSWSEMSNFGGYGGEVQPTPRAMQWADKQYLTEGWLASRTPTQYLTVAARASEKQLKITRQADDLRVTNDLGAAISLLVVRDHDGNLFTGGTLEPGASAELPAVNDESKIAAQLRTLFQDHEPVLPEGFEAQYRGIAARQYRAMNNAYGDAYGGPAAASRLEQRIASFTQPLGAATGWSVNLPSGTYLAITLRGIEVATGLPDQDEDDSDEEDSFHVVHGQW